MSVIMSAIPDYGLKNDEGMQILSREYRFNHLWYASKILLVYDNDDMQGMKFTTPPTEERGWPEIDTIIPVPIL